MLKSGNDRRELVKEASNTVDKEKKLSPDGQTASMLVKPLCTLKVSTKRGMVYVTQAHLIQMIRRVSSGRM